MHPSLMCQKIWEHRADIGIAHDGDADRVLLCDEKGSLIDGDDIMAIAGLDMLAQGTLAKQTLVSTVMSNAGLEAAVTAAGGKVVAAAALVDRSAGTVDLGVPFTTLIALNFPTYAPEEVPAELAARPAIKPGSRSEA